MYEGDVKPGLRRILVSETVGDFQAEIVTKPATLSIDATLRDAIDAILQTGPSRKAYVLDDAGVLRGTISIETLMRHAANRLGVRPPGLVSWLRFVRDMESDNARDFMTGPVTVTMETPIIELVSRVVSEHLNDFPVVDDHGQLIGEVNTFSLLKIARSTFPEKPPELGHPSATDTNKITPSSGPPVHDQVAH